MTAATTSNPPPAPRRTRARLLISERVSTARTLRASACADFALGGMWLLMAAVSWLDRHEGRGGVFPVIFGIFATMAFARARSSLRKARHARQGEDARALFMEATFD